MSRPGVLLAVGMLVSGVAAAAADPAPGISRELARWRAAHYRGVEYKLRLDIEPRAASVRGELEIAVMLERKTDLVLDWRPALAGDRPRGQVRKLQLNGKPLAGARFVNEHILIAKAQTQRGRNVLQLEFESPVGIAGSAVTRYLDREDGTEYLYSLFVPSDASSFFPCFDQPDLKARFTLEASIPGGWTMVSNAAAVATRETPDGPTRVRFGATEPISTYLFAFAAGPFASLTGPARDNPTRLLVRKSKLERARAEAPEVLRLNQRAVEYFERYFDAAYPFGKYDLVLIPEFPYGGMEHAGASFLREDAVLFPFEPSGNDLLRRAQLIFHETSHQWFGDLVTMRWFDDLWLKEGFANFMAAKATEALLPQYPAWNAFHATKVSAYRTDVTKGTTPIYRALPNLSAAKSAYGNIVYSKAPAVLRQAEFYLGDEAFRSAVRDFLRRHRYANAEWNDLVRAFERASGRKLARWAAAWVKRRGMPAVSIAWKADKAGRIADFTLKQRDVLRAGGIWPQKIQLALAYPRNRVDNVTVTLTRASQRVPSLVGKPAPTYVYANFGDYGYGQFLLDKKSLVAVTGLLGEVRDDFLRALLWDAIWDGVREARFAPADYIELGMKLAAQEPDEVTLAGILARMQLAYSRYLSDTQRGELAARLENFLEQGMRNAPNPGLRITYLRIFVAVATTDPGRATLKRLLDGSLEIPAVPLRSRDRFGMIRALIVRGDAEAEALLAAQTLADSSDEGRRYAYAAQAARPTAAAKQVYFSDYLDNAQLPEAWIEESLAPFNSIEQAVLTLPYLARALDELPALRRKRRIFFVNNWLAAFIGGQIDARALKIVQTFLGKPGLDADLRLKVLETVDDLERTVRIRAKYARAAAR